MSHCLLVLSVKLEMTQLDLFFISASVHLTLESLLRLFCCILYQVDRSEVCSYNVVTLQTVLQSQRQQMINVSALVLAIAIKKTNLFSVSKANSLFSELTTEATVLFSCAHHCQSPQDHDSTLPSKEQARMSHKNQF